jgi:hypothetical protein
MASFQIAVEWNMIIKQRFMRDKFREEGVSFIGLRETI